MPNDIERPFRTAVEAYLLAPTAQNRAEMLSAADAYRESWISARAEAAGPSPQRRTEYARELEVTRSFDGIPVTLALQERQTPSGASWWTLSWRTKYAAGGPNRRFYLTKDGVWTIPAAIALEMLDEMEERGGLADAYLDSRVEVDPDTVASTSLAPKQRKAALSSVVGPDEDWGPDPFFVVCSDPNPLWKKVMIVNSVSGLASFRSITESSDYMPKKVLRPGASWWLDNSMMDANVQQTRQFHSCLRDYLRAHAPE